MIEGKAFLWQEKDSKALNETSWNNQVDRTLNKLSSIYKDYVEPVENQFLYKSFKRTNFEETMKQKLPFVTFLGPFSSGKSTIINYLIQHDVLVTGPQPVTDKFTVISYGEKMEQASGKVLIEDPNSVFRGLSQFGQVFSDHFTCILAPHPLLRSFTLIDTPGVLEASTKNHSRRYNYADVARWFVEKSDLVFLLFDPTKLETGAELQSIFNTSLRGYHGKVRIILNKSDSVQQQELMRVYGALFWNLSNLIRSTEPPRVYVCSLWNQPYAENTDHTLFESEKIDLLYELFEKVPMQTIDIRVTSMLKRARDVWIFAIICATYRTRLPMLIGKSKAKKEFFENYFSMIESIAAENNLCASDFPNREEVRDFLKRIDSSQFPNLHSFQKSKACASLKQVIDIDLPQLFQPLKQHSMADPRDRKMNLMNLLNYNVNMPSQNGSPAFDEASKNPKGPRSVASEDEKVHPFSIAPV